MTPSLLTYRRFLDQPGRCIIVSEVQFLYPLHDPTYPRDAPDKALQRMQRPSVSCGRHSTGMKGVDLAGPAQLAVPTTERLLPGWLTQRSER
jgi:hypothetical protein